MPYTPLCVLHARFCADLKINVAMMPLLASAIGNDYVGLSLLRPFHVSLGDLGEVLFPLMVYAALR